jgi:hypothetical protein
MKSPHPAMAALVLCFLLGSLGIALAQNDAHMGNWKLNVAKSKFEPGPAPQSETRSYEPSVNGYKLTGKRVAADGTTTTESFAAMYDGKDTPLMGDLFGADTLSVKLVDSHHIAAVEKKSGKPLYTTRLVVSQDGKTMTMTIKGKNAKGEPVNTVTVYDRQ